MLGGLIVLTAAGFIAWKYRDSLTQYVQGNTEPAKEKVDELLWSAQQKSETLLDQAKVGILATALISPALSVVALASVRRAVARPRRNRPLTVAVAAR